MKRFITVFLIFMCIGVFDISVPAEISAETLEKEYGISVKWIEPETDYRSVQISSLWENGVARVIVTDKNLLMRSGLIDTSGNTIAPFIYDDAYLFSEGKFFVSSGGSKIIIDSSGKALFDVSKYDTVVPITDGYSIVITKEKYGMIDENGTELLPCEYDYLDEKGGIIYARKGAEWQQFDKKGHSVNVKAYDGFYVGSYEITKVKKDGKHGIINDKYEEVIPCIYNDVEICDNDIVAVFDEGWKYINLNDESNSYYYAGSFPYKFSDGLARVYSEEKGKYGYINKEWELVIPFKYSHAWDFENGLAKVSEEPEAEKWYHIDKNGEIIIPPKDYNVMVNGEALIGININSGWTGRPIPPQTDKAVLDSNGNRITEFIYFDIQPFENGVAAATKNGLGGGLINKHGAEITPFGFSSLYYIEKNKYSFSILDTETGVTRAGILTLPDDASEIKASFERPISVYVNGVDLYFDAPPVIINDRVLVPMRKIFEKLGCEIVWNEETKTVTAVKGEKYIKLTVGESMAFVNGSGVNLDCPAVIMNDRTLVPVRFIADSLNLDVDWDAAFRRVYVN